MGRLARMLVAGWMVAVGTGLVEEERKPGLHLIGADGKVPLLCSRTGAGWIDKDGWIHDPCWYRASPAYCKSEEGQPCVCRALGGWHKWHTPQGIPTDQTCHFASVVSHEHPDTFFEDLDKAKPCGPLTPSDRCFTPDYSKSVPCAYNVTTKNWSWGGLGMQSCRGPSCFNPRDYGKCNPYASNSSADCVYEGREGTGQCECLYGVWVRPGNVEDRNQPCTKEDGGKLCHILAPDAASKTGQAKSLRLCSESDAHRRCRTYDDLQCFCQATGTGAHYWFAPLMPRGYHNTRQPCTPTDLKDTCFSSKTRKPCSLDASDDCLSAWDTICKCHSPDHRPCSADGHNCTWHFTGPADYPGMHPTNPPQPCYASRKAASDDSCYEDTAFTLCHKLTPLTHCKNKLTNEACTCRRTEDAGLRWHLPDSRPTSQPCAKPSKHVYPPMSAKACYEHDQTKICGPQAESQSCKGKNGKECKCRVPRQLDGRHTWHLEELNTDSPCVQARACYESTAKGILCGVHSSSVCTDKHGNRCQCRANRWHIQDVATKQVCSSKSQLKAKDTKVKHEQLHATCFQGGSDKLCDANTTIGSCATGEGTPCTCAAGHWTTQKGLTVQECRLPVASNDESRTGKKGGCYTKSGGETTLCDEETRMDECWEGGEMCKCSAGAWERPDGTGTRQPCAIPRPRIGMPDTSAASASSAACSASALLSAIFLAL